MATSDLVTLTFASWNQIAGWLRRLEGLGRAGSIRVTASTNVRYRPTHGARKVEGQLLSSGKREFRFLLTKV